MTTSSRRPKGQEGIVYRNLRETFKRSTQKEFLFEWFDFCISNIFLMEDRLRRLQRRGKLMVTLDLIQWAVIMALSISSIKLWIEFKAIQKSTHQVQFVPAEKLLDEREIPGGFTKKEMEEIDRDLIDDFEN